MPYRQALLRVDSRGTTAGWSMMLLGCGGILASISDSTSFPARSPMALLCWSTLDRGTRRDLS